MNGVHETNIDCSFILCMEENYCILSKIQLWPTIHLGPQHYLFDLMFTKLNTVSARIWPSQKHAGDRAFSVAGSHLWNGLPSNVCAIDHMDMFKNELKSYLFP